MTERFVPRILRFVLLWLWILNINNKGIHVIGLPTKRVSYACSVPVVLVLSHTGVTDRAGIEPRVARSRVQRLNHWAIKVPERPSRLRLAGSLHYSPPFWNSSPWLGPLSTKAGSFHSQANPGYRCHQCNGPCGDRTPGRLLQSPTPKPLGHKGTWTTQSLTLGWFVTQVKQTITKSEQNKWSTNLIRT